MLLEVHGLDPDWLLLLLCKQYARLQSTFSEPICCPSTIFACCPNQYGDHYSMHVLLEQIHQFSPSVYTCYMFLLSCLHCSARFTYVDRATISTWNSIHYPRLLFISDWIFRRGKRLPNCSKRFHTSFNPMTC